MSDNLECKDCGAPVVAADPDPPDPDTHGNRRWPIECNNCDNSGTALQGPHGGFKYPEWVA